jgi:hypothetical protein
MTDTGRWFQRFAVFFVSIVIILAELAFMRELALRFWDHLAWLAISIALLGFGISGTMLVLIHHFFRLNRQTLQLFSLVGLGLSLPGSVWLGDSVEVHLIQMVWQPAMMLGVGTLELVLGVPFVFGGMFVGLALEDKPDRIGGHYAASFLGSAVGGIITLPFMFLTSPRMLILLGGCSAMVIAVFFIRNAMQAVWWSISVFLLAILILQIPCHPRISDEKDIVQIKAITNSKIVAHRYGPQGKIELVEAPTYHSAPGLALNYYLAVPPRTLIVIDGQVADSLYRFSAVRDFAFMDHTTMALPYVMGNFTKVLIDHDAGSGQLGLALFHGVEQITTVTGNAQFADLVTSKWALPDTNIYAVEQVELATSTLREHLRKAEVDYPLIVLPTAGSDPAGLTATEPDSRMTIETMQRCFSNLSPGGLLSVSTTLHLPPRESLRLLNMFVEVLRQNDRKAADHLVMIRNWATITIVITESPLTQEQSAAIREFCLKRGFDLVWLPGLQEYETNKFHLLDGEDYYHGAMSLIGDKRNTFVDNYLYDLSIPDDNAPFFNHFSRWQKGAEHIRHPGRYSRTSTELGTTLLSAALAHAFLLAAVFVVLPLFPVIGLPGDRMEQATVLGFFSSLGFGFMLLEIGLLQRLTVYLAHPVWAAATVISGFMLFGGIGSSISTLLQKRLIVKHLLVIAIVIVCGVMLMLAIDKVLGLTEGFNLTGRFAVAYLLIAPLAMVMGMAFPLGLKRLGTDQPRFIPWAWSANGFTSVLATLCAPAMAMLWGFDTVIWSAIGCYGLAAVTSLKLPEG